MLLQLFLKLHELLRAATDATPGFNEEQARRIY
jgi:hypothetical protein